MKKISFALVLLLILTGLFPVSLASGQPLLILSDGEAVPYEPYALYLTVSGEIGRLSARQGIVFTRAMESYLQANNVILSTDEFLSLCGEEMNSYLESETFTVCRGLLKAHYDLTDEQILRSIRDSYWSQYVAQMLSAFYRAQEKMSGESAEMMFSAFTEQFYENLSFCDEADGVAVFGGETIAWTDGYRAQVRYNELTSLLATVDTIALNRSVEKYLDDNHVTVDYEGMDESIRDAVASMQSNEIYSVALDEILAAKHQKLDDFLVAMTPFVEANFQRASFGGYCYELYQAMPEDQRPEDLREYYYSCLDGVSQTYQIGYLGW